MTPRPPLDREFSSGSRFARLAALAALAIWMLAPTTGPHIERVSGRVEIGSGEPPVWRAARDGDALSPGDAVRTARDGRAELTLPAGSVRLYGDSLMRLPPIASEPGGAEAVELDSGSSLFDVLHRGRDLFEVHTPEVVVSIKGTRFLVVAGDRAEVSVFRGSVGLRPESESARELLVREGFAAVGSSGRPFELLWSGAPDPWEAWPSGALPPRSSGPAGAGASPAASDLLAAKAAAHAESRRVAVEQAIERHPEVAKRVEQAIAERDAMGRDPSDDAVPAAPAADTVLQGKGNSRKELVEERYVESLLNGSGGSVGSGSGSVPGAGSGASFDVTLLDDSLVVTDSGQSWTLSEGELESIADGQASLPAPLENAIGAQGKTAEQFAEQVLRLLD